MQRETAGRWGKKTPPRGRDPYFPPIFHPIRQICMYLYSVCLSPTSGAQVGDWKERPTMKAGNRRGETCTAEK